MTKYLTLILIGTLGAGLASVANAQAVFSDNFAGAPTNGSSGYTTIATPGTFTDNYGTWTVFTLQTVTASVDLVGGTAGSTFAPNPPSGSNYVDLLGTDVNTSPNNFAGPAGISTSIGNLTAGTYTLSFDFLSNYGAQVDVNIGSTASVANGTTFSGTDSTWVAETETLQLGAGTNYISLYSVQNQTGYYPSQQNAGVTNISLQEWLRSSDSWRSNVGTHNAKS